MLVLCTATLSVNAALRYVDSAVATSGNGQSWATAWKGIGNITGLQPGDTVYFSGGSAGKSYAATAWAPARGTSGNPITYAVGQETGHNGVVTFTTSGQFLSGNLSDITINGEVNGQRRMAVNAGNNFVIYSDGQDTHRFKFLWVTFTGGIWCRSDYTEIAYCNGTSPLSITDDSMIAHIGDGASASGWGVNKIHHNYFKVWRKKIRGEGFDCLKWCGNVDVYDNQFIAEYNPAYTGSQHNDAWQGNGEYTRIFNNYFENWISYPILLEAYGNSSHWRVFNNVFYANETGVDWTAYWAIAIGFNPGALGTFSDFIIANNTIIGGANRRGIGFNHAPIGTVGANCYIVNNIVYDSDNVVGYNGNVTLANNVGGTSGLTFVNNAPYPNGDFSLTAAATSAINRGINPSYLTAIYATDAAGNARTGIWDIGAYEFGAGGPITNPVVSVSTPSLDFGSVPVGTNKVLTITVRNIGAGVLSGQATVSPPFSIVSGGTYSLGSNQSQAVTIRYTPLSPGNHSQTANFSGGGGATASVSGSGWAALPGLSFESIAGIITLPFVVDLGGFIYQIADTGLAGAGRAVYAFTITNAGDYTILANVNAPADAANSFFVNIDGEPTDPAMIWDILPLTSGFENRPVSWRGSGAFDSPEFPNKVFTLSAGAHQLIVLGREAGAQLGRITITPFTNPRPTAPSNLQVLSGL